MVHHPDEDFDHPRQAASSPLRRHVLYRISRGGFATHGMRTSAFDTAGEGA